MSRCQIRLRQRIQVCVVVAGLVGALAVSAAEAAVTPWSLTDLTLRAGLVVHGRIIGQSSTWNHDKTAIFTDSTVDVLNEIKGHTRTDRLVIRTPGGVVGGIGLWVEPVPHFLPGEEVLVFLAPSPAGGHEVVGATQGKYAVQNGWAVNDAPGTTMPLIALVRRILVIMDAHGYVSTLPPNWVSRFAPATGSPPRAAARTAPTQSQPLGYAYDGQHWPGPNPMGEDYRVNANTSDVPAAEALQAIQSAADTWTNVSGADFEFTYGGSSTATDKGNNGKNEITWRAQGTTGTLATAWIWYWSGSQEIFEADMVINDSYQWDTSGSPAGSEFDLQSVALHEFGHYLHLGHDNNGNAVMYYAISAGTTKRTLHQNDVDGIRFIYPGPFSTPTSTPTPTATSTPTPTPTSTSTATPTPTAVACLSDFDGDGTVTLTDIAEMTSHWHADAQAGDPNYDAVYDVNADGIIDVLDISVGTTEMSQYCN